MKFKLDTARLIYSSRDKEDKEQIRRLKKLGFQFEEQAGKNFAVKGEPEVNTNSLEELRDSAINLNEQLVVDFIGEEKSITIYDGYLE